jgi:hypothetical protein
MTTIEEQCGVMEFEEVIQVNRSRMLNDRNEITLR